MGSAPAFAHAANCKGLRAGAAAVAGGSRAKASCFGILDVGLSLEEMKCLLTGRVCQVLSRGHLMKVGRTCPKT